jgi:hypothetical protein
VADTFKVLGQSAPAATTLTDLYTVPAATSVTSSSIVVCNRGTTTAKFRVSVAIAGAVDANAQYLYYDRSLPANDTFTATLGITLAATDKVRVQADTANCSFNLFGVEVT